MKTAGKIFLLTLFVALLALPAVIPGTTARQAAMLVAAPVSPTWDDPQPGDKLVLGGTYTLEAGQRLNGSLVVMGGMAKLEADSLVTGDVAVLGGTLDVDGQVQGDVNVLGGLVSLGEQAVVNGDINLVGGNLQQADGAVVEGQVNDDPVAIFPFAFTPGTFQMPWNRDFGMQNFNAPWMGGLALAPVWGGLTVLFRSLVWAVVALLVALFAARPLERTANAAMTNPAAAGGLGCLTAIVAPLLLVILAITICLAPFSLLGGFLLTLAWGYGLIALGFETGRRMVIALHQDWAPVVVASLGTFVLTLVVNAVGALVPCVGWMLPALVGSFGLGAVLLTRFGARSYPPGGESMRAASVAYSAPATPVVEPVETDEVDVSFAPPVPPEPPTQVVDLPEE